MAASDLFNLQTATFCEATRPGLIAEPANTWSSLIFVFIGAYILWLAWQDHKQRRTDNPLVKNFSYGLVFGPATILVGIGSILLHATQTYLGGVLDTLSMYLVASFLALYNLSRRQPMTRQTFFTSYVLINIPLGLVAIQDIYTRYVFLVLIAAILISEYWTRQGKAPRAEMNYFRAAVVFVVLSMVIWMLDITKTACNPHSLLQGHALWHFLTAAAIVSAYLYLRSEKRPA